MTWCIDPADLLGTAYRQLPEGGFRIEVPADANIAADLVTRHAAGPKAHKTAILFEAADGTTETHTYRELERRSTALAASLRRLGIERGDRVAIHSVPRPETVLAHLATYKLGAIATTISALTGPQGVSQILGDSGARVLFTHERVWAPLRQVEIAAVEHVIVSGGAVTDEHDLSDLVTAEPGNFRPVTTGPEDAALLIYTSGSTGRPKGILHGHRILHALNSSLELFYNLELHEDGLVFWTPADWAWIGGLNDVVFPSLAFGHTLVATEHRFDPEWALGFLARHGVTHGLMTPTALKRIALVEEPRARHDLRLRTIFTGGEPLPGETHRALSDRLGIVCNEGYGMTEVNQMIGNCQRLRPVRPGSMGWVFPARKVRLVNDEGDDVPDGEVGEIVVSAEDPTLFLGYWNQPELTAAIRTGDGWIRTHDLASKDADGYFWYRGRSDDLIKSAGFRIGPAEIEEVLLQHPEVVDAGVIGVPDTEGARGTLVKACIVRTGTGPDDETLADELRALVKERLGPHKQPRLIEFFPELPTTSSGKIGRAELRRRHQDK